MAILLYTKIGFRGSFITFILIFSISQFACSYIKEVWIFIFVYGIFAGIAQGGYVLPLYCCWRYFEPSEKAKVAGVLLSAYALAPIPNSFLALKIVNPDDVKEIELPDGRKFFPADVANNVPFFLRVFSVMIFCLGMLGVMFIKEPIDIENLEILSNGKSENTDKSNLMLTVGESSLGNELRQKNEPGIKFKKSKIRRMKCSDLKIFKNKHFLNAYFIMLIEYLYPLFMLFVFKKIAFDYGRSDLDVTVAGTIGALVNAVSRFFAGFLFQKRGYLFASMFIMSLEVLSSLTFIMAAKNEITFSLALSGSLGNYGCLLGLYPLVSDTLFSSLGAFSYSILMSSFAVSNMIILSLGEDIRDLLGGWEGLMYVLAVVAVVPIFNVIGLDKEIRKRQNSDEDGD